MKQNGQLGRRLKEYRKASQLKQKDVSRVTGITCASLCHWERGVSKPSAEQLEVLVDLYNERLSRLYPHYVPVTLLPPLRIQSTAKAEAIGKFREELESFNGNVRCFLECIAGPDKSES